MCPKNLIVFDHPYTAQASENVPHFRSFSAALNKAITEKLRARGEEIDLIDLHADGFDPVMSQEELALWRKGEPMSEQIAEYQHRMLEADRIIFVFPIWWELMPAMTKGFIDKVYAKNLLYDQPEKGFRMKTRLKANVEVVLVSTMGTPKPIYNFIFSKPVVKALHLGMCFKTGVKNFRWLSYSQVDELSLEQRQKLLDSISI